MKKTISSLRSDQKSRAISVYEERQKNPRIALLLSVFLGYLGADRIYIRSYPLAVIKLGIPLLFIALYFGRNYFVGSSDQEFEFMLTYAYMSVAGVAMFFSPLWWIVDIFLIKKACRLQNERILKKIVKNAASS